MFFYKKIKEKIYVNFFNNFIINETKFTILNEFFIILNKRREYNINILSPFFVVSNFFIKNINVFYYKNIFIIIYINNFFFSIFYQKY